jgi:hypothetical protein
MGSVFGVCFARKDSLGAEERFRNAAFYQDVARRGRFADGRHRHARFLASGPLVAVATVALASGVLFAGAWRREGYSAGGFLALIFLPALVMARVLTEKPANGTKKFTCFWRAYYSRDGALPALDSKADCRKIEEDSLAKGAMPWLIATAPRLRSSRITRGPMIPSSFITVSWGAVGILLLAAGLICSTEPCACGRWACLSRRWGAFCSAT